MPTNPSNLPAWRNRSSTAMASPASPAAAFSPAARTGYQTPGPQTPVVIVNQETNGLLIKLLGFYALACCIPIAEILIIYLHIHIPVVLIADLFLTLGLFTTGHIGAFWKTPGAKAWVITLVLFALAALFSQYKSRSLSLILPYLFRFHIFPFYFCAMATRTRQIRSLMVWIGAGSFLLLGLVLKFGELSDGRLLLPDTDLANPNDLGLSLLFALAAVIVFRSRIAKIISLVALPVFLLEVIKTGSRACTLTVAALAAILFFIVPTRTKLLMLIAIPLLGVIVVNSVSSFTLSRLTLLFSSSSVSQLDDDQLRGAIDSQRARAALQMRAVELSLRHPIFGVGANMFADAVEDMVHQNTGEKSGWQGAHNTYLEVAAENGIPAMLCYTWALLVGFYANIKTYKLCRKNPVMKDAVPQSLALILMGVAFLVCTGFSNNAYDPRVCVLVGISAANYLAVRRELAESTLPGVAAGAIPNVAPGSGLPLNLTMPRPPFPFQQSPRTPRPSTEPRR